MGAVVPVAEPDWSGAHHGLCLYASRVLQAVWDEQARSALLPLMMLVWQCCCSNRQSAPLLQCRRCCGCREAGLAG